MMSKTIQQIIEEQRQQSKINNIDPTKLAHTLTNLDRKGDQHFKNSCSKAQLAAWNDPERSQNRRDNLNRIWTETPEKMTQGRLKPIHTPWGEFRSRKDAVAAAPQFGINQPAVVVTQGLINDPDNFYYIGKTKRTLSAESKQRMIETKLKNGSKSYKKVQTPFGIAPKMKDAVQLMKLNGVPNADKKLRLFLKDPNSGYRVIK